jgi:hypothetical protein
MPLVGFEPTIPVLEQAKTVHALDRATTGVCNSSTLYHLNIDGIITHKKYIADSLIKILLNIRSRAFNDSCSAGHEIPASWKLRVQYSILELTPLASILSQIDLLHPLITLVVCDQFNIILRYMTSLLFCSGLILSHFAINILCSFLIYS